MAEKCAKPDRKYSYDNIKFMLIFLVVFAHLLEVNGTFKGKNLLYEMVYSFHMPMFIFLSGFFARYNRQKIAFSFVYTYILMQVLYSAFKYYVLTPETTEPFSMNFTTPYWLLWYLLALIFFYLLIPFFQQSDRRKQAAVLIVLFAVSLLFGFDSTIGYYFSLARFFSFLPFFVLGMYVKDRSNEIEAFIKSKSVKAFLISFLLSAILIVSVFFPLQKYEDPGLHDVWFQGIQRGIWSGRKIADHRRRAVVDCFFYAVFSTFCSFQNTGDLLYRGKHIPYLSSAWLCG